MIVSKGRVRAVVRERRQQPDLADWEQIAERVEILDPVHPADGGGDGRSRRAFLGQLRENTLGGPLAMVLRQLRRGGWRHVPLGDVVACALPLLVPFRIRQSGRVLVHLERDSGSSPGWRRPSLQPALLLAA